MKKNQSMLNFFFKESSFKDSNFNIFLLLKVICIEKKTAENDLLCIAV